MNEQTFAQSCYVVDAHVRNSGQIFHFLWNRIVYSSVRCPVDLSVNMKLEIQITCNFTTCNIIMTGLQMIKMETQAKNESEIRLTNNKFRNYVAAYLPVDHGRDMCKMEEHE